MHHGAHRQAQALVALGCPPLALVVDLLLSHRGRAALALWGQDRQIELGTTTDAGIAQVHHADHWALQHTAKRMLVSRFKRGQQTGGIQSFALHGHLQRVGLAHVKHVKADDFVDAHKIHTGGIEAHLAGFGQRVHPLQQAWPGHIGQGHVQGLHRVVAHVGHHATQGRSDTRVTRHDAGGHAHLAHHGAHMQAATAAKGHVGKLARIVAALDRHHADRAGHAGVGHRQNRLGCGQCRQAQRLGHMLGDGLLGQARVQRLQQAAPQRTVGRDAAQQHIGVGQGGAGVAASITGRAGNTAR